MRINQTVLSQYGFPDYAKFSNFIATSTDIKRLEQMLYYSIDKLKYHTYFVNDSNKINKKALSNMESYHKVIHDILNKLRVLK